MRWSGGLLAFSCWVVSCGSSDSVSGEEPESECAAVVEDGGGGIEAPPDGAELCPSEGCNYQTSEGCSSAEACLPTRSGSDAIVPGCVAAGDGRTGDECTPSAVPSDCAPGHFCADGVCRRFCCGGDWSACDENSSCFRPLFIRLGSTGDPLDIDTGVSLCFPTGTCHVLEPDSCDEDPGRTCKVVDPTGAQACVRSGAGQVGEPCGSPEYCGAGLSCVGGTCRRLCRAEACGEPGCPQGEGTCVHLDRNPPGVGECTPNFVAE